ncbi:MAG: tetratricopeptide repeat protein [Planctomycetota bacterium]
MTGSKPANIPGRIALLVMGMTLWCGVSTGVAAGEPQGRFFDQLRARQLFGLAERYCLEKLARPDLPPAQRIDFAYELSRTFVQHALVASDDQQEELWDRARKILEQTTPQVGAHERKLLLELQEGFVRCARGQALRWQVELVPDDTATRQLAIQELRDGIERLTRLEAELKVRLRKPPPKDVGPQDKFIPAEIRGLMLTTDYELGHTYFGAANLLATDDPDRIGAIQEAERWLGVALSADRDGEVGLTSQVLVAGCARLRIEAARALRLLDDVKQASPSAAIRDQVLAERARVFLMQKKPVEAADLLTSALKTRTAPPGELVSLRIQVLIELWQAAEANRSGPLASELRTSIDEQLQRVQVTNPGYWSAYCESLVTQAREARTLGHELAQQIRTARGLYLAKQVPAAIKAYTTASQAAKAADHEAVAYDMAYTKGSIEIEAGHFHEAVKTFDQLVTESPRNPRAPHAHFLAAYALGQLYTASATKQNREAYTAKLEAQRRDYPQHSTSGEAIWLLGQLEEKRLQNSAAIRLYQQVPATHPRAAVAAAASARCYDRLLTRLRELQQPTQDWETEAITRLTQLLPTDRAVSLTEDQAVLALHLSNIALRSQTPDFETTDRWLEWVARSAVTDTTTKPSREETPNTPTTHWAEYSQAAAKLRVVSLAGQQKFPEAEKTLAGIAASSPTELLSIIDGLSKLVAQAQDKPQHNLGELQLRAALNLKAKREELEPADQQRLDHCIAEAYVAAGRYEQALGPFRELLKTHPKDPELMTGFALLLMKFGQRSRTEEAQQLWKRLEGQNKPGSRGWFDARYQFARCELDLGNAEKALKLIGVTKVLFPQLGGAESQQRFQELQTACEQRITKPGA